MDFIQGQTLMEKVKNQGSLSESECLKYIRQIGDALATVHQAGFVHRDAHPGNIMIQPNGKAILIDFGIAKNIIPATRSSTNNAANLSFAPYEQIYKGSNASREPNVDVYSLAATFYYAITGKLPTPSMERRLDNRPLIPPQQFNRQLSRYINDAIILGMALEKENRPQSMSAWLQQLDLSPQPVEAKYRKENIHPPQDFPNIIQQPNQNFLSEKEEKVPWVALISAFASYGISGYVLGVTSSHWFAVLVHTFAACWVAFSLAMAVDCIQRGELAEAISWNQVTPFPLFISLAAIVTGVIIARDLRSDEGWFIFFCFMFMIFIWIWSIGKAARKLSKYFNRYYCFFILASNNLSGIGFGWLMSLLVRS
jgi:serine/threonine-protein kinase